MINKNLANKALKSLISRLEKTEKFVLDQAPAICKEIITEAYIEHLIPAIWETILGISVLTGTIAFILLWKGDLLIPILVGILGAVLTFCFLVDAEYNFRFIYFVKKCPKLFLLRKFRDLLSK